MSRRRLLLWGCAVLILLNLAFIWGNSALPGEASMHISTNAMSMLGALARLLGPLGEKLLRKIAHFAEFACLGLLLTTFFRLLRKNGWSLPLLLGLLAACIDETIQLWVPGRASSLLDVWLDGFGILAGIITAFLGQLLIQKLHSTGGNQS